jgi:hypothetical protein
MNGRCRQVPMFAKNPVRFFVVSDGKETLVSEHVEAKIRDLTLEGLALETPQIKVSGLHISYNDHPLNKNRLYLQWELPTGKLIKAVGQTIWYERASAAKPIFVIGLRFVNMSQDDKLVLKDFLSTSTDTHPLEV